MTTPAIATLVICAAAVVLMAIGRYVQPPATPGDRPEIYHPDEADWYEGFYDGWQEK